MKSGLVALGFAALVVATSAAQDAEPETVRPVGPLVIAGGAVADDDAAVWEAVLSRRLAGRPVCILPTASAEPRAAARRARETFERFGGPGSAFEISLHAGDHRRASSGRVASRLAACGGFWFTGGDQSRIVDTLRPGGVDSAAARAIRRAHDRGAVVAGTSAGAAMMSDPMIGDGTAAEALEFGVVYTEGQPGVWMRSGMGFLLGALTDQHHLARGRFGRLLMALAGTPAVRIGYGVDENTAVVVDAAGVTVVGASAAVVLLLDRESTAESATGNFWLLGAGSRFDVRERRARFADSHVVLPRGVGDPSPPTDPWSGDAWWRWVVALAGSRGDSGVLTSASGRLTLTRGPEFRAVADPATGVVSAGPFGIEWHRVPH